MNCEICIYNKVNYTSHRDPFLLCSTGLGLNFALQMLVETEERMNESVEYSLKLAEQVLQQVELNFTKAH